jgi:hypothetical protein
MENIKTLQEIAKEQGFSYIQVSYHSKKLAADHQIDFIPVSREGSTRFYKGLNSDDEQRLVLYIKGIRHSGSGKAKRKNKYSGMGKETLLKKLRLYSKNIQMISEALNA